MCFFSAKIVSVNAGLHAPICVARLSVFSSQESGHKRERLHRMPPVNGWSFEREAFRSSALLCTPLTPEEIAQRNRDEEYLLKITAVLFGLFVLSMLCYFVAPHLGIAASFFALFSQNPVLAGVINFFTGLSFLLVGLKWSKAYIDKKKARMKPTEKAAQFSQMVKEKEATITEQT
jgi:hypothetical protein